MAIQNLHPKPYGGSGPMEEMSASGGWIGNAINYGRFISHLDGTIYHPHFNDSFNYSTVNPFGGFMLMGLIPVILDKLGYILVALDGTSTQI